MKKYISGFIVGLLFSISITAFAANLNIIENPYKVFINGVETPVKGYNIDGYTYLKLAEFKKAGLGISFDNSTKYINVTAPTVTSTPAPEQAINNTEVSNMNNAPETLPESPYKKTTYKGCQAIDYNSEYYILAGESRSILHYKMDYNAQTKVIVFSTDKKSVDIDTSKTSLGFYNSGKFYIKYSFIEDLLGE